jgi:hypothetical protein
MREFLGRSPFLSCTFTWTADALSDWSLSWLRCADDSTFANASETLSCRRYSGPEPYVPHWNPRPVATSCGNGRFPNLARATGASRLGLKTPASVEAPLFDIDRQHVRIRVWYLMVFFDGCLRRRPLWSANITSDPAGRRLAATANRGRCRVVARAEQPADQPGDQIHDDCGVLGDGDTSGDTWPLCVPTNGEPREFWRFRGGRMANGGGLEIHRLLGPPYSGRIGGVSVACQIRCSTNFIAEISDDTDPAHTWAVGFVRDADSRTRS